MAFKRNTGWQHLLPCHRGWILGGWLKGDPSGVSSSLSDEMAGSFLPSRRLRASTLTVPHSGQQASLVWDWCVQSPMFKIMKCKLPGPARSSLVLQEVPWFWEKIPGSTSLLLLCGLFLFSKLAAGLVLHRTFLDFSSTSIRDFK